MITNDQIGNWGNNESCYWDNICALNARQEAKGLEKYGEPLEENTTLTTVQRIEHAQEEAIDLLKYLEHLKRVANDGITANDFQRAALRTAPKGGDRLLQGVVGLGGEAGEVLNLYEKHKCQGHELDREKFIDELSDVAWYLAIAADAVGVKLGDVFEHNKEKLEKRFPQGFSKERSINREQ